MKLSIIVLTAVAVSIPAFSKPLNLLIVTVDDMSCDSMGVYGCPVPDTSPTMDRLAAESFRFQKAHVVVGNCFPSRNVMWSGLYPHNTGVEGFYKIEKPKHAHLVDVMQKAGYFTAIRGKASHSAPYHPYHWDLDLGTLPDGSKAHSKDADSYGISTKVGIEAASAAGKPFCVMINISDPHKPFYAQAKDGSTIPDEHVPSKIFTAEDMTVPGFLFDDPIVKKELSHYYSSVRRADDCLAKVLEVLETSGEKDNTIILFLSDHGMPLPFAKTQVYHHSSRTPLMVLWPGITQKGAADDIHMISAVDIMPTIIEMLGVEAMNEMDGRSFASILKGEKQDGRDFIIKEYNENSGRSRDPMRAIQTGDHLYIFNPWSNGERIFATATNGTQTYKRMAALVAKNPDIKARHDLYQHRVVEELYSISKDPDCLHNLIDNPEHATTLKQMRGDLYQWMKDTGDHCLVAFENRSDPAAMEKYVTDKEAESAARGGRKKKALKILRMPVPKKVSAGKPVTLKIPYKVPQSVGETNLCVTLKSGGKRLDREMLKVSGNGIAEVTLAVPSDSTLAQVSFAAWVGKDHPSNLQHLQKGPVPVEK